MHAKLLKAIITTALAALVLTVGSARADDTDVYINPGAGLPEGSEPMVMFSLDYRPNLAATACTKGECDTLINEGYLPLQESYIFFDVLRAVLRKVFDPLEGVRVGLMLNHDHINNCAGFAPPTNCSNAFPTRARNCFLSFSVTLPARVSTTPITATPTTRQVALRTSTSTTRRSPGISLSSSV